MSPDSSPAKLEALLMAVDEVGPQPTVVVKRWMGGVMLDVSHVHKMSLRSFIPSAGLAADSTHSRGAMKVCLCLVAAAVGLGSSPLRSAEADRSEADTTPGEVLERGPHHNVLRSFHLELAGDGQLTPRAGRLVQLEDSLNYWDEDLAQWAPAVAEIELIQGLRVARRGQQQALFTPER